MKYRGVVMKFEINNSRKNDNSHTWYLNYQNKQKFGYVYLNKRE